MQLAANTVIAGRFRLNRQLGRGGMGSVWHATHLALDIPCAVKFIEGEYSQLPEAQARFEREAKAAAQLRSPHVVQILDHGLTEGVPYIAMELLDGEDLGKRISRLGRMSPSEVITVMSQVCRALTKAHSANIVHRDLKPDNIFLVKDDDREIAKVLDFGIAKANTNSLEGSNTKTGAMLGTPYYMSPEQAQGTKSVDSRSDLWSLAVIVFQAITGKLPFESEALGDLLVKIIVSPIPVPSQVAPDVPPAFDRWWAKAAARDPAQRFQTAREFSDSLSMVFGVSQATEVMDRGALRQGVAAAGGTLAVGPAHGTDPGVHAPMQMTPTPHRQPGGTQALPMGGHTPQPHLAPAEVAPGNTGAPFAHTFGGHSAQVPKKNTGLFVVLGGLALLLVAGGGVAAALALKGAPKTNAGGGTEVPTASVTAKTPDPTPSATVATAPTGAGTATGTGATEAPKPEPSASSAPTTSGTAVAANPTTRPTGAATQPTTRPTGATTQPTTRPTTQPTTRPTRPGDLGF